MSLPAPLREGHCSTVTLAFGTLQHSPVALGWHEKVDEPKLIKYPLWSRCSVPTDLWISRQLWPVVQRADDTYLYDPGLNLDLAG